MSHSRTTSNGTIKLLQWCGSSMQSCHLLCVSWAEPVRWIVTATDELLWMESPKKPGREFCFPPFFCSNKDVSSLWDNYWKITGVHPPVERCSCTVLMGPWSCSHLPLCQPMMLSWGARGRKHTLGLFRFTMQTLKFPFESPLTKVRPWSLKATWTSRAWP